VRNSARSLAHASENKNPALDITAFLLAGGQYILELGKVHLGCLLMFHFCYEFCQYAKLRLKRI